MKTKIFQPLWYHQTSVMLLDDDAKLLNSLVTEIDPSFPPVIFTDPKKALVYLKEHVLPLEKLSHSMISDIEPSEEKHLSTENVAIDFSPLHANLDKPTRFTRVLVLVVDRAMNDIDGLDICRKIRESGLPVKLILLTGHTSIDEAVTAFNNGIIDAFVQKSTDLAAMAEQLNPYIKKLAFQVFCESSAQLLGLISTRLPFLTKETHAHFLQNFFQEHKVDEYYTINTSGSCLLITLDKPVEVLLMKTDRDFKDAFDVASSDHVATDILDALKSRRAFPFTGTKHSHFDFDVAGWQEVMVPMKKVENLNLFYGLTQAPEQVMTFDHYVKKLWKPTID